MFDDWTDAQARAALGTLTDGIAANKAFYDGDHWQGGDGWAGPRPLLTDADAVAVLAEIARAFISANKVAETVRRHASAVLGKEPAWSFAPVRALADGEQPNADEQARIDEAEAALTALWDVRGLHTLLHEATRMVLWAGRAPLRLYVPQSEVGKDGRIPVADLATSVRRIYLDIPQPHQAGVTTDARTRQQAGVYMCEDTDADGKPINRTELVFLDAAGRTVLRVFEQDPAEPIDLGGRLTIYQMEQDALITEPVRQQQRLLNLAKTMMGRNVVLGGFLERIILNAQLPDGALRVGAGTTNALMGAPIYDDAGNVTGYTNPSVIYRDPVPVTTFEDTERSAYRSILEETNQLHALISGDATASGESRKQARADFEDSVAPTTAQAERAIRWLLETTLALGAAFAGQVGRYADLRAVVTCRVNSGPISGDEQNQARLNLDAGLLSTEGAMARIGVDDTDAEKARIEADRAAAQARAPQTAPTQPQGDTPQQQGGVNNAAATSDNPITA